MKITWFSILTIISFTCPVSGAGENQRPNILFMIADDWGYGDASVYGRDRIQTPANDRVAGEGLRFDNAYWSHIHSCFDSSDNRLYQDPAGIVTDPVSSGFKKFIIKPAIGGVLTRV